MLALAVAFLLNAQYYPGPPMWDWDRSRNYNPPRHRPYGPGAGAPTGPGYGCIQDGTCRGDRPRYRFRGRPAPGMPPFPEDY